ncbi:hypothetical protein GCM10018952_17430 [Streptosporangium vulgare]
MSRMTADGGGNMKGCPGSGLANRRSPGRAGIRHGGGGRSCIEGPAFFTRAESSPRSLSLRSRGLGPVSRRRLRFAWVMGGGSRGGYASWRGGGEGGGEGGAGGIADAAVGAKEAVVGGVTERGVRGGCRERGGLHSVLVTG